MPRASLGGRLVYGALSLRRGLVPRTRARHVRGARCQGGGLCPAQLSCLHKDKGECEVAWVKVEREGEGEDVVVGGCVTSNAPPPVPYAVAMRPSKLDELISASPQPPPPPPPPPRPLPPPLLPPLLPPPPPLLPP